MITVNDLKKDKEIQTFLKVSERQLEVLGYTEHSSRHVSIVSKWAGRILTLIEADEREIRLAEIAGYLHDIGNAVNRNAHAQSGALLAYQMLIQRGVDYEDAAEVMLAIGNHDEGTGTAVSKVSAALILADKSDVHRSRVRHKVRTGDMLMMDIHDRVNYAVEKSVLSVDAEKKEIVLNLDIDTAITPLMDYFEIFLGRMTMCRRAAEFIGLTFSLDMNGTRLL